MDDKKLYCESGTSVHYTVGVQELGSPAGNNTYGTGVSSEGGHRVTAAQRRDPPVEKCCLPEFLPEDQQSFRPFSFEGQANRWPLT